MVMLTLWRRADVNNGNQIDQTVTMNGEGTVLRAQSPTLAGYWSKDDGKEGFNGVCTWCSAKGQTNTLRSYAVNFKESITLCTSPQCLYPLVSRPLEDVHSSLSAAPEGKACKRKPATVDCEEPHTSPKRRKEAESNVVSEVGLSLAVADVNNSPISTELCEEKQFANGQCEQGVALSGGERPCTPVSTPQTGHPELSDSEQTEDYVSSTQEEVCEMMLIEPPSRDLVEMVPAWPHLFWRNRANLCWLDSLLVALVHFRAFQEVPQEDGSFLDSVPRKGATVINLCRKYVKICTHLKTKEQQHPVGKSVLVPLDILQKAEQELAALQLSVFRLLKPKLQCELGQQETPVFALPLLLRTDTWAQGLFQHTATWEFTCTICAYTLNTCVEKTVTTFTQLVSDWHPLRAVHRTQCNNCHRKNQRRKLVFQNVSSVLALHFVEGLPRKDISKYSFDFQGEHYDITTIIQYDRHLEHFVTWILQSDGSWLEFDDLKYPHSITHKRFTLPAKEFHLVFWEAKNWKNTHLADLVPEKDVPALDSGNEGDHHGLANSVPNDTCIVDALTIREGTTKADAQMNLSIGSTTLLDTFEGLSHEDIVTLTLVEVKVDADGKLQESAAQPAGEPEETSARQAPSVTKPKRSGAVEPAAPPTAQPVLPSAGRPAAAEPVQAPQHPPPARLPSKPPASSVAFLYQQHPSHRSTPVRAPPQASPPKLDSASSPDALPAKPAELFRGFRAKNSPKDALPGGELRSPLMKVPSSHPAIVLSEKPPDDAAGSGRVPETLVEKKASPPSTDTLGLSATEALRLKLMKKLKAKKKKLARLNVLLGKVKGEVAPKPDSTDLTSLPSVTSSSSACVSPAYDHFIAELLSPGTTSSNLSPDSTGLLEILTSGQAGPEISASSPQQKPEPVPANLPVFVLPQPPLGNPSSTNDFFDEFISGSGAQQSAIENTDFNALDMFF